MIKLIGLLGLAHARVAQVDNLIFAFFGVAWASWAVRLPEVKELIHVSTAELGLVLLAGSIGSLSALLASNRFIERFGTKPVLQAGTALFAAALGAAAVSAASGAVFAVAGLLFDGFWCRRG